MKRPKLKASLARLQAETIRSAKEGQSNKAPKAPDQKMVDRRVVWHHWSDGHRSLHPYRSASLSAAPSAVLVIGDADLSFSRALMEIIDPDQIIATIWEADEEELVRKYPIVAPLNLAAIRDSSTRLLWGIDATKLSLKYLAGKMNCPLDQVPRFTRIVFNFPHTGEGIKDREQNIKAQQRLISAFLQAATNLLKEQASCPLGYTQEEVTRKTLMAAPPSTDVVIPVPEDLFVAKSPQPEIHLTCWTGDPYDDWEVKKVAATVKDLSLLESFVFTGDRYPGYQHCRTIGFVANDETFLHRPARTFVLVRDQNDKSLKRAPSGKNQKVKSHKRGPLDRHPKDKSSKRGSLGRK